jgi:uncharacterized membrane protein (DUF4010 family)
LEDVWGVGQCPENVIAPRSPLLPTLARQWGKTAAMDIQDLLSRFAVALGIGLLIGLERGWRLRDEAAGRRAAGIRTFAISGLLGGIAGALALSVGAASVGGGLIVGIGFAAYAAVIAFFSHEQNRAEGRFSATTAVAGMVTFALGAYALMGEMRMAAAGGVVTAALLAGRENLHGWVARITWAELRSGLVLLAMTFVALPLVPNAELIGGVNPREIWLIAIVLAGVSFLGYVAVKYTGPQHGILLSAAAGGLVSSTAVTLANARRAAQGEGAPHLLAAGVSLATAISYLRVAAIVAALQPHLLALLAAPLAAGIVVTAGAAAFSVYGRDEAGREEHAVAFRNPFSFLSVIGFALLLGAVTAAGKLLAEHAGATAAILGALAMGLADVDAVTAAMTRLVPEPLGTAGASYAILAAVAANTLSKLAMGVAIGGGRFARELIVVFGLALAAGAAALWIAWRFVGGV